MTSSVQRPLNVGGLMCFGHTAAGMSPYLACLLLLGVLVSAPALAAPDGMAPSPTQSPPLRLLDKILPRAQDGNTIAQYNVGVIYDRGYGVEANPKKALSWYKKAAAKGYAKAAHNIGVMYQNGRGVDIDNVRALHWFTLAAQNGLAAAQNNLAVLYAQGRGTERDMALAAFWFARAVRSGNPNAKTNFAIVMADLPRGQVSGQDVNVRAKPITESTVLKQVSRGGDDGVVIIGRREGWVYVVFPSDYLIGWIADFLVGPAPASALPGPAVSSASSAS